MKWHRSLMVVGLLVAFSICAACAETPVLDRNWGKSFEAQKTSQIMNPEAGKNLEPVAGMDGKIAVRVSENYENRIKEGAKERPADKISIFTIGTSGSR